MKSNSIALAWSQDLLALYSASNLNRFIQEAFRILPRLIACQHVSAFYRRAGDGFLKERDSRGRVWGPAFMRRYVELTPAIPLVLANPGVKILTTRFAITESDAELQRSAFYKEVMKPQGWRHGAVLCFWADSSPAFPILVLTLYREAGRRDFSDQELAVLEELHPFLAAAVTRFHQISFSTAVSDGIASTLRHVSGGVVVLDGRLHVVRANLAGRRACAGWEEPRARTSRPTARLQVPGALVQVCDALRLELQSAMRKNPDAVAQCRRRVAHPTLARHSATATAICQPTAIAEPIFVLEFETAAGSTPEEPAQASLLARLTRAEREVALVVAQGLSNEETAERLGKTVAAVKFLLHRVYKKLGVANRAKLALAFSVAPGVSPTAG